jgi:hypothetical protein
MARKGIPVRFSDEEKTRIQLFADSRAWSFAQAVRYLTEAALLLREKQVADIEHVASGKTQIDPSVLKG